MTTGNDMNEESLAAGLVPHAWLWEPAEVTAADPKFVALTKDELIAMVEATRNSMQAFQNELDRDGVTPPPDHDPLGSFERDAKKLLKLKAS